MIVSRVQGLIDQIEADADPTHDDLRRVATLQVLDVARAGEVFVAESQQAQEEADAELKRHVAR